MRVPFVAGNWKMYKTVSEARTFVAELVPAIREIQGVDKVICPPFVNLMAVNALLEGSAIGLGAQNMHWEEQGAYTGEVSPVMLAELCEYVILGHSERRGYFCETDANVNKKMRAALAVGLTPIVCIGETLEENEAGKTAEVLEAQIANGFVDISLPDPEKLIVAYEPIWAIGTGKAATAEGANAIIADVIRPALESLFGAAAASRIRVLYGGSVKANNAREFFEQPDIDGGLVGGACLKVDEFTKIIQAAI
ncbi:MAG: triose-phosphate isomerase [Anaerolineales bacterium]|jgi:triosephosphate isomerase